MVRAIDLQEREDEDPPHKSLAPLAMASSGDREQLMAQVKRDVRSLLISAKSGLAIQDLYRDYQSLVFSPLPFRQLGFQTARAFLQSIPDVCRCQLLPGGDCLVTAVADSSTAHIQKMVERQKPSQKRGATARVLASRYVRRSTPARPPNYRSQQSSSYYWHRSLETSPSDDDAPKARPQPLMQSRPQPPMQSKPQSPTKPAPQAPTKPAPQSPTKPAPQPQRPEKPPSGRTSPEPVPARVAGRLAQVLLSHPDGVPADRLPGLHDAAAPDEPLDWQGRGYRSCAELLLQLPHIARVVNAFNGLRVYPARALIAADRESGRQSRQSATADADRPASRASQSERTSPPAPEQSERRPSPTGASGRAAATGSSSSGRRGGRRRARRPAGSRAELLRWARRLGGGGGQWDAEPAAAAAAAASKPEERYLQLRTALLWTEHRARLAALRQEARLRAAEHRARLAVLREVVRRLAAPSAELEQLRRDAELRRREHRARMAVLREVQCQVAAASERGPCGVQELVGLLRYL
ncbi:Tudor domain-containing protein 5 [Amphibalanus amphitrite]|uniref:Tudor domain-containing protein 5 n=1 Tax=Amphibalanus amphitrite TaxID=1232801 RepID=A0A6A4V797_AMPAM|nr:Tudor domain-containing protein 5 [Amphibalanus amphitrite]